MFTGSITISVAKYIKKIISTATPGLYILTKQLRASQSSDPGTVYEIWDFNVILNLWFTYFSALLIKCMWNVIWNLSCQFP